jgi:acyl carrier protein
MASRPIPARDTLEQQLITLIAERLLATEPGFGTDSDLYQHGLDSMAIMQLLVLLEEEYGVAIPESALTRKNFGSVRQLARLVGDHAAQAA